MKYDWNIERVERQLTEDPAAKPIELFKTQWRMLHVLLNEINKLSVLRALEGSLDDI